MNTLRADLRDATRSLLDRPGLTFVAVLTLALGIGANSAIFSVLDRVLLRPLPFAEAERLVMLWGRSLSEGGGHGQVSATDVIDWRDQTTSFEAIGSFSSWRPILSDASDSAARDAERVGAAQVSEGFFDALRGRAELGRLFRPQDQLDGNDTVVVLSHALWQRRFAGDPAIVGSRIRLNLVTYTVIGVLPDDFTSLPAGILAAPAELYRPLAEPYDESQRSARHVRAVARLREGVQPTDAGVELSTVAARLAEAHPESNADYGVEVVTLRDELVGDVRPVLLLLLGVVGFVLLIACVNVANLQLARAASREREIAVRAALGAGRLRIVRQLLTESLLLALLGAGLGLLLAAWGLDLIKTLGVPIHPELAGATIHPGVILFTLGLTVLTVLLSGLAPAWRASRPDLDRALRDGGDVRVAGPRNGAREGFLVFQIAMSLVLLVGAGLTVRSVSRLERVDPGFVTADKLAMDLWLPWKKYRDGERQVAFFRQALERVRALPAVEDAGVVSVLPLDTNSDRVGIEVEGRVYPPGRNPSPDRYVASPGYLSSMPIRLVSGRRFDASDRPAGEPAALISETFARTAWPGEDPLGKRFRLPPRGDRDNPWRTVIGVVGDVKQRGLDGPDTMQFYLPLSQYPWPYMTLVVRTAGDPGIVGRAVREELRRVDADVPVFNVNRLEDLRARSMALRRFAMWLLAGFAGIALVLSVAGIYGVFSYAVSRRRREVGVRMALGARYSDVMALVLGRGVRVTALGLVVGLAAAWSLTRLMTGLLFGVGPTDPLTFALVGGSLAAVAIAACWIPARRAASVDPAFTLRGE
jgi:putative ABC transport system permease protein